jgi:hypothetical protein
MYSSKPEFYRRSNADTKLMLLIECQNYEEFLPTPPEGIARPRYHQRHEP